MLSAFRRWEKRDWPSSDLGLSVSLSGCEIRGSVFADVPRALVDFRLCCRELSGAAISILLDERLLDLESLLPGILWIDIEYWQSDLDFCDLNQ
jgi:hypothetical protein